MQRTLPLELARLNDEGRGGYDCSYRLRFPRLDDEVEEGGLLGVGGGSMGIRVSDSAGASCAGCASLSSAMTG